MLRNAAVLCWLLPPVLSSLNCFSQVDELKWSLVVEHNATTASIAVLVSGAGPNVITCLNRQEGTDYRVWLAGDSFSEKYVHPWLHSWDGSADRLLYTPPVFNYLIYGGRYRVEFASCDGGACGVPVVSDYINIQSEVKPWCEKDNLESNSSVFEIPDPIIDGMSGLFEFTYRPCSDVQDYDTANLTLFESVVEEECWGNPVLLETLAIKRNGSNSAAISFQTPQLQVHKYFILHHGFNWNNIFNPNIYIYIKRG